LTGAHTAYNAIRIFRSRSFNFMRSELPFELFLQMTNCPEERNNSFSEYLGGRLLAVRLDFDENYGLEWMGDFVACEDDMGSGEEFAERKSEMI
jgi:hypothetical protein